MSTVEWRKIPGLNERHEVTACGRVRTLPYVNAAGRKMPGREKKVFFNKVGKNYLAGMVRTSDGGVETLHLVHRLVAAAFIGECPPGCEVLHRDGDSTNNHALNLRYGTRQENVADTYLHGRGNLGETHPMAKLSDAEVRQIRQLLAAGERNMVLAARFNVSPAAITSIKNGTRRSTA